VTGLLTGARDFPVFHRVQTGYQSLPASCAMGTGYSIIGGKVTESVKLTTELHLERRLRRGGNIRPLPPNVLIKRKDSFAFAVAISVHIVNT
jgi:hypothetical protein